MRAFRRRQGGVLNELFHALKPVRNRLMNRLEDVDVEDLRRRSARYAEVARKSARKSAKSARKQLATRVRPKPKSRMPMVGLLLVGAAAAGIGYLVLQDRRRREVLA